MLVALLEILTVRAKVRLAFCFTNIPHPNPDPLYLSHLSSPSADLLDPDSFWSINYSFLALTLTMTMTLIRISC